MPDTAAKPIIFPDSATARVADFARTRLLTCAPETSLTQAAALMHEHACGSVLVVEQGRPVGIWTERDAARIDFHDPAAFDTPVASVMSGPLATIDAASSVGAAVLRLREARIRHLVVVDATGAAVGIVTQTDLALRHGIEHFLRLRAVSEVIRNTPPRLPGRLTASDAARHMAATGSDAVIVEHPDGMLGILTEHDLLGLVARRQAMATLWEVASFPLRTVPAVQSLLEARRLLIDGHIRHLGITDASGAVIGLLSLHDVLEMLEHAYANDLAAALRQRDEELLHSHEELSLARQVIDSAGNAVMIVDAAGLIVSANPAFARITGHAVATAIGRKPDELLDCDRSKPDFCSSLCAAVDRDGYWRGNLWCRHRDGATHAISMSVHAVTRDGRPTGRYAAVFFDITENAQAERTLREERDLIAAGPSVVFKWAPTANWPVTYVSPNVTTVFGHRPEDLLTGQPPFADLIHPADRARVADEVAGYLAAGEVHYRQSYRLRHADGRWRWIDDYTTVVRDTCGVPLTITGYILDVSEHHDAEETLQLAASVFSHAREGIMITTPDGIIVEVNDAFSRITGYRRDEAIGKSPALLKSDRQGPEFHARMWRALTEIGYWVGEVWNRRKDGTVYAELLTISAVRNGDGKTRHYVALFSDITAQKEHQQQLEHIAHYDALTTLPNRVLLADRLNQALVQAKRRSQKVAVAYIDLDGFKAINDNHGHAAGDALLIALAQRMRLSLREGDTIARLGGDEFVAVLVDLHDIQDGIPLILRLLAAAAAPVEYNGLTLQVSASIGVSFPTAPTDSDADQLLRQADQAMYRAKLAGKNRYHIFDPAQYHGDDPAIAP